MGKYRTRKKMPRYCIELVLDFKSHVGGTFEFASSYQGCELAGVPA